MKKTLITRCVEGKRAPSARYSAPVCCCKNKKLNPLLVINQGKKEKAGGKAKEAVWATGNGGGFIEVDPRRVRFQYAKIRPVFSGCGRAVEDTLEEIRSGALKVEDLPPIQVVDRTTRSGGNNAVHSFPHSIHDLRC